jgi:hypothetical protein
MTAKHIRREVDIGRYREKIPLIEPREFGTAGILLMLTLETAKK